MQFAVVARRTFASAAAGASRRTIPRRIQRLVDSTPVSLDERFQKMLELEKWMKKTGVQLQLPKKVLWFIPELPAEFELEVEDAGGPAAHPAFDGFVGRVATFRGDAYMEHRNLRARIGSDGKPCSEAYVQRVFDSVSSEEDLEFVEKTLDLCAARHLRLTPASHKHLVAAFARIGALPALAQLLARAPHRRLFLEYKTWAEAITACGAGGDTGSAEALVDAMLQHSKRPPSSRSQFRLLHAAAGVPAWVAGAKIALHAAEEGAALNPVALTHFAQAMHRSGAEQLGQWEADVAGAPSTAAADAEEGAEQEEPSPAAVLQSFGALLRSAEGADELASSAAQLAAAYPVLLGGQPAPQKADGAEEVASAASDSDGASEGEERA